MKKKLLLFATALSFSVAALWAADVKQYHIAKGQSFIQSSSGTPVSGNNGGDSGLPFQFEGSVDPAASNDVTSATIRFPDNVVHGMTMSNGDDSGKFRYKLGFNSQSELDAACPAGSYLFNMVTANQGTKTPTLTFGTNAFPVTPHISNWAAAQAINVNANFSLTWDAFTGETASD